MGRILTWDQVNEVTQKWRLVEITLLFKYDYDDPQKIRYIKIHKDIHKISITSKDVGLAEIL